jgi:hypothetical protein
VVTASASVRTKGQGGSWGAGAGTLACDATSGAWTYIPTQAETNFTSFVVQVYKASCIGCGVTVVTTASAVPGRTMPDAAYDAAKTAASATNVADLSALIAPALRTVSAAEDVVVVKTAGGATLATFTKTSPGGVETWTRS